jgi:hypothetical protein
MMPKFLLYISLFPPDDIRPAHISWTGSAKELPCTYTKGFLKIRYELYHLLKEKKIDYNLVGTPFKPGYKTRNKILQRSSPLEEPQKQQVQKLKRHRCSTGKNKILPTNRNKA